MTSSVFNPRALQSFSTISLQVFWSTSWPGTLHFILHPITTSLKCKTNKATIDSRLHPRCHIVVNSTEHCSCLMLHSVLASSAVLNHNTTRGQSHDHRQHAKNWFDHAVFELCEWTDRKMHKQTYSSQYNATLPGKVIKWTNDTNHCCFLWQKHQLKHCTSSVKFQQLIAVNHNIYECRQVDCNPSDSEDSETKSTSMHNMRL